jgi:hypothetical protein
VALQTYGSPCSIVKVSRKDGKKREEKLNKKVLGVRLDRHASCLSRYATSLGQTIWSAGRMFSVGAMISAIDAARGTARSMGVGQYLQSAAEAEK